MASIKPLPEAVHRSVRSSVILFDLTRVVEELIYNSLDAAATKVSVFIGIGTCYVKVVDDGSGITRDGLALLGERYATSKLKRLADMDAANRSFGFRGEALGSISDVSLLEIITKSHGRPNGYRKVMKGCKCLYLGIDDDRQDVGTTVVVRDLFYNQPVRRKHMQSSPKKVLHSVNKCVLRIALVHSKVSFKVVDIESEDKLLCTFPSSSPLSLLTSGFGNEISSSLHQLNLSDGILELSGYMSNPFDTFSMKALQYVYINSRYVCKGPIHKLLSQLAISFDCLDPSKINSGGPKGKRSRPQAYPSYILNLRCPQSQYDLNFEPTKTSVEFKDWVPILTFIKRVITQFWSEQISSGDSFSHADNLLGKDNMLEEIGKNASLEDLLTESKIAEKVCRNQNLMASHGHSSSLMDHLLDCKESNISFQKFHNNTAEDDDKHRERTFVHRMEYPPYKSWDGSLAKCTSTRKREVDNPMWTFDKKFHSAEQVSFISDLTATERPDDQVEDCFFGSTWDDDCLTVEPNLSSRSTVTALSYDFNESTSDTKKISEDLRKPFLQSCSSQESLSPDELTYARHEGFEFQDVAFRTKRKRCNPHDCISALDVDVSSSMDFFPGAVWLDGTVGAQFSPKLRSKSDLCVEIDFKPCNFQKSFSFDQCVVEHGKFSPNSITENFGSSQCPYNSESQSLISDPLFGSASLDAEHFSFEGSAERDSRSGKGALCEATRETNNFIFSYDSVQYGLSPQNRSFSCCVSSGLDFEGCAGPKSDKYIRGHNLSDIMSPRCSDMLTRETDWLYSDSSGNDFLDNFAVSPQCYPSSRNFDNEHSRRELVRNEECGRYFLDRRTTRRSHSAPPLYRGRKKFLTLKDHVILKSEKVDAKIAPPLNRGQNKYFYSKDHVTIKAEKLDTKTVHEASTYLETGGAKDLQLSSGACYLPSKPNFVKDLLLDTRPDTKKMPDFMPDMKEIQKGKISECPEFNATGSIEDSIPVATYGQMVSPIKCRNRSLQDGNNSLDVQCEILDISSGILHLASDSLVPQFDNKNCLEGAKVLQQVDRKFIPVVASGTLAIIDQHAADERIRLEELRQKVLSGEVKTITYLDTEQELVLPETCYQLLQNYAEQIQSWGWICNIHAQGSKSFKKNMNLLQRRPAVLTLLAVPCILGVNLSDVDLLEFLQQLADTDGSSTVPPAVTRVLNFKACRGAIMFGDSLLPSECSLIVAELKQTSLCFQCAHGRPTTVPLVNLETLHKQIAKLRLFSDESNGPWHGLQRHAISFKRAAQRLNSA